MKKLSISYVLFFAFALPFMAANAHTSQVPLANNHIKSFIQTWGLIKYRSPKGVSGQFQADRIFLSLIDQVAVADRSQFNQLMAQLLTEYPASPKSQVQLKDKNVLLKNIDYRWIRKSGFDSKIEQQLIALTTHYSASNQHYYIPKIAHESEIPNEELYTNYTFDQEAMNLLALAKAWNGVAYLFPYKYVTDQTWEKTLLKMIPIFRAVHSRTEYEKSMLILESALGDTHAAGFLNQLKTAETIFKLQYYPPFEYQIYQHQIVVQSFFNDSLAKASPLKTGDLIVEINGIKTKDWLKQRSEVLPASNQSVKYRLLTKDARFSAFAFGKVEGPNLQLRIRRGHKYSEVVLPLLHRQDAIGVAAINSYFHKKYAATQLIKGYEELNPNVALIRAGYFFDKDLPNDQAMATFTQNLQSKKAIIFDMRAYPASPGLFYYFLPTALGKSAFEFAQYFGADLSNPGAFKRQSELEIFLSKDIKPASSLYQGKIVILTNADTQSMGEWFTMMLSQVNTNTTIIGSQTAGADGDLKRLNLPGGYQFLFTGNGIFYPNGKETQRKGIVPDVYYRPSLNDLLSAKDQQLEKAIQYINSQK